MKKRHLPLTHELCERAILDAYRKKWKRRDYAATIEKYGGVDRVRIKKEAESGIWNLRLEAVHSVALEMEQRVEDLLSGDAPDLDLDPVKTFYRIDGISMKRRELSSCCPLHQCFSHLAVLALAPLFRSRLYPWQYASLPKKGQVKLKQQVEKWLRRKSLGIRHAIKLDVKSAYKSTKHEMVMKLLRKDIPANAWVMPVVLCLMQMSGDGGLLIGGYLEAWLFNLVASYMLAKALSYRKVRRGESRTLVVRAVNYADDFALLGRRWADIQSERRNEEVYMIAAENLDHQPQTVTLERLPDGTALLWLRKDIRQTTPQDETAPGWECSLVTVHLTATQEAQETEESVQTNFDAWWNYTPPTQEPTEELESRVFAAMAEGIRSGVNAL